MFISKVRFLKPAVKKLLDRPENYPASVKNQMWDLFPRDPNADRDFIFRFEEGSNPPIMTVISEREPQINPSLYDVQTKPYDPQIEKGMSLVIKCVANTVEKYKGQPHGVITNMKKQAQREGLSARELPSRDVIAQEAGKNWLEGQGDRVGFDVNSFVALNHGVYKDFGYGTLEWIDFKATITVKDDPKEVKKILMKGLGKRKCFGFGLVLARRA